MDKPLLMLMRRIVFLSGPKTSTQPCWRGHGTANNRSSRKPTSSKWLISSEGSNNWSAKHHWLPERRATPSFVGLAWSTGWWNRWRVCWKRRSLHSEGHGPLMCLEESDKKPCIGGYGHWPYRHVFLPRFPSTRFPIRNTMNS